MPARPGPDAPDASDTTPNGGDRPVSGGAQVRAPRADAGPKRPPRPDRARAAGNGNGNGNRSATARPRRAAEPPTAGDATDVELVLPWHAAVGEAIDSAPPPVAHDADQEEPSGPRTTPLAVPPPVVVPAPVTPSPPSADRDQAGPARSEARVERRRGQDPGPRRGRRVRRVVRRIELWSVLKLATVLYTCLYVAVLATVALLWGALYSSGQMDRVQSFLADVGLDNYRFYGDQMFRACAAIGAVGVLAATIITVLTAALVNVISELTGGIRVVVIEEDPPPRS